MKIKVYIFTALVSTLPLGFLAPQAQAVRTPTPEYRIKAAFLYNFIKFVDWPEEKMADSNEPITIGIIGTDPFGCAFEAVKDKKLKGRKVVIKRFEGLKEQGPSDKKDKSGPKRTTEALRKCHLLFISSSEKERLREIINLVMDDSVLTVGDMKGFLESGGIINFLMEDKKVRFEINVAAAKKSKLKISSKLLRLAKRVVEEKSSEQAKK
jgi:hypothetical protein